MARLTCQAQAQRRVVVQHYSDDDEDEGAKRDVIKYVPFI